MVLESTFDATRGSLATLLVQRGTLKKGDYAVSGTKFCRVRQEPRCLMSHHSIDFMRILMCSVSDVFTFLMSLLGSWKTRLVRRCRRLVHQ